MIKAKPSPKRRNADIKRRYFHQLREASGLSEATVDRTASSIGKYEDFLQDEDFARFNESRAIEFRKHLGKYRNVKGKPLSLNTIYQVLRAIDNFFRWLMTQPGYKSKIAADDIEFLQLDKKSVRAVQTSKTIRPVPTVEYVLNLVESIDCKSELGKRDKALIAFTLVSAMRDRAIVSLTIGSLNVIDLTVNQDPLNGAETKFSKANHSRLFEFDKRLLDPILLWVTYLKSTKAFSLNDPLFPAAKRDFASGAISYINESVGNRFWSSAGPMRQVFKKKAESAGLDYFPPHSFRHLATHLALDLCSSPQQIRAISQNLGHENIGTTLLTYGSLDDRTRLRIMNDMNFSPSKDNNKEILENYKTEELLEVLLKRTTEGKPGS